MAERWRIVRTKDGLRWLGTKDEEFPSIDEFLPRKPEASPPKTVRLTVQEAAAYMRATVPFVRSLYLSGKLRYFKSGKKYVFDPKDLDALMEKHKETF